MAKSGKLVIRRCKIADVKDAYERRLILQKEYDDRLSRIEHAMRVRNAQLVAKINGTLKRDDISEEQIKDDLAKLEAIRMLVEKAIESNMKSLEILSRVLAERTSRRTGVANSVLGVITGVGTLVLGTVALRATYEYDKPDPEAESVVLHNKGVGHMFDGFMGRLDRLIMGKRR